MAKDEGIRSISGIAVTRPTGRGLVSARFRVGKMSADDRKKRREQNKEDEEWRNFEKEKHEVDIKA